MTVKLPSYIYDFFSQYSYTPKQKRTIDWYLSIIAKRYNRGIKFCNNAESIEVHHIIPKSIGPQYQYDRSNLIPLTIREHVILHHLLALTGIEKMEYAFHAAIDYRNDLDNHIPVLQAAKLIEQSRKGISHPVRNLTTGEVFSSVAAACKAYNSKTNLQFAIKTRIKACGCYWQYEDIVQQSSIEHELAECNKQAKKRKRNRAVALGRPVVNLNTKQRFQLSGDVNQWLKDNVDHSKTYYIQYAIKNRIRCGGYFWQYEDLITDSVENELQRFIQYERNLNKHLIVVDLSTGVEYSNCAQASQALNLDKNAINKAARTGIMHAGRYWMHLDLFEQFDSCEKAIEYREQQRRQKQLNGQIKKSTAVYCLNTGKRYINVNFAAKEIGCNPSSIITAAKKKIKMVGYYWAYEPEVEQYGIDTLLQRRIDNISPRKKPTFNKPVKRRVRAVVNLTTGEVFDSVKQANESLGGHCNIVTGIKNGRRVKGYYWQYKDVFDQTPNP